ncbi:hypothetical protein CEXT_246011 [Caerostris extrusa]|uniref:Uncharacterized protein n=1 Tax=Caerostris extrusa TaxID=172846 RepID=A0AAV4V1R9_CAEEX|nr:hypothetical protein CEXT_246011 [Caerostris extrusa]
MTTERSSCSRLGSEEISWLSGGKNVCVTSKPSEMSSKHQVYNRIICSMRTRIIAFQPLTYKTHSRDENVKKKT